MLANVSRKQLEKNLKKAQEIIDFKSSHPILQTLKLRVVDEQTLEITATNLEQGLIVQVPMVGSNLESSTAFCVDCKKFYEIVKSLKEEEIILEKNNNRLIIKNPEETTIFELATSLDEEFPNIPAFYSQEINYFTIAGAILKKLIKNVIFAASTSKGKFTFNSVYLEVLQDKNILRAVATDGNRLAIMDENTLNNDEFEEIKKVFNEEGFLIDREHAEVMIKIAEEEEFIRIGKYQNYIILNFPGGLYFSQLLEGTFPDYKVVIPQEFINTLKVERVQLEDAITKAKILGSRDDSSKIVPIKLNLTSSLFNEIEISSIETDIGKAKIKCPAEYSGENLEVTLNAEYLLSVLKILNNNRSQKVRIDIAGQRVPIKITGENFTGFLYLVMPMVL